MSLHRNRLPARILAFFGANPDEELTTEQVAVKFGASRSAVKAAILKLTQGGHIENVRIVRNRAKGIAHHPTPGGLAAVSGAPESAIDGSTPCAQLP